MGYSANEFMRGSQKMKTNSLTLILTINCFLIVPWGARAGGLLGDNSLVRTGLGQLEAAPIPKGLWAPSDSGQAVIDALKSGKPLPTETLDEPKLIFSYEELIEKKNKADTDYENRAKKILGTDVSNICLTPSGACPVEYAISGSSCFCTKEKRIELGIVE